LADDHHFVCEAIANYLSRVAKDIVCSEVADLLQAKEKLAVDAAFGLIMLDYQMPGMNEVTVSYSDSASNLSYSDSASNWNYGEITKLREITEIRNYRNYEITITVTITVTTITVDNYGATITVTVHLIDIWLLATQDREWLAFLVSSSPVCRIT